MANALTAIIDSRGRTTSKERCRELRLAAGLSQYQASQLVHKADKRWALWERGTHPPDETAVHLFCLLTGQSYVPDDEKSETFDGDKALSEAEALSVSESDGLPSDYRRLQTLELRGLICDKLREMGRAHDARRFNRIVETDARELRRIAHSMGVRGLPKVLPGQAREQREG